MSEVLATKQVVVVVVVVTAAPVVRLAFVWSRGDRAAAAAVATNWEEYGGRCEPSQSCVHQFTSKNLAKNWRD